MYPLPENHTAESFLTAINAVQKEWDGDYSIYSTDNERVATSIGNRGGRLVSVTAYEETNNEQKLGPTLQLYILLQGFVLQSGQIGGYYGTVQCVGDELVATDGTQTVPTTERRLTYNEMLGE